MDGSLTTFIFLRCVVSFHVSTSFIFSLACCTIFPLSFPFPYSSSLLDMSSIYGHCVSGLLVSIDVIFQSSVQYSIMCPISSSVNLYCVGMHS
jgi:hypothetical protein